MTAAHEQIVARVKQAMRTGEYLRAYDWALIGLEDMPNESELQYLAVLALARTGATDQAQSRYKEFGLSDIDNIDYAALEARLVKDKALVSHPRKKPSRFTSAAKLYEAVFARTQYKEFYPAINAATTYYLAGDHTKADSLARTVLSLCQQTEPNYWRYASEAEAHLLMGNIDLAVKALESSNEYSDGNLAAMGATKKQLALICNDPAILDTLKIPRVAHFAGHIISTESTTGRFPASLENEVAGKIEKLVDQLDVGIGYGSLAAGADILFAEAILRRGGELHITLPFNLEEFKRVSVACSGEHWLTRFDACWEQASSHSFSSEGSYRGDNTLFNYCSLYSMGRACLKQQHLAASLSQLLVWDEETASTVAGTYSDYKIWTDLGYESHIVSLARNAGLTNQHSPATSASDEPAENAKQLHAILFGDIRGFSSLSDAKLPKFVKEIMGCLATVLDNINAEYHGDAVLMANTWGDGLFIVLRNVEIAAQCAIHMQQALKKLELNDEELQEKAELRLGIHFGPIYEIKDPVTKRENFFGEHVNRAARIEPITPPGQVYVTESFAAQLALTHGADYKTEYVGYMPMAKNYGDLPMYLLREAFDD